MFFMASPPELGALAEPQAEKPLYLSEQAQLA